MTAVPADGVVDRLVLEVSGAVKQSASKLPGWLDRLAAVAAAAVSALAAVTFASAEFADGAIKAARAAGITVEEYTALAYAADLAGVSTETLMRSSRAVAVALTAAAGGSEEYAEAFKDLGIDAAEAAERGDTFAELLPRILDGLKAIPEPMRRSALAMKVLGRGSQELATLIDEGGDSLRAATAEAEAFGVVVSTEAAEASEALLDDVDRLWARVRGLSLALGLRLVPAVNRLVTAMAKALDAVQPGLLWAVETAANAVTVAIDAMLTPLGRLVFLLGAAGLGLRLARSTAALVAMAAALPVVGAAVQRFLVPLTAGIAVWAPWILGIGLVIAALDDLRAYLGGGNSITGDFVEALGIDSETYQALTSIRDLVFSIGDAFVWVHAQLAAMFSAARAADRWLAEHEIPLLSEWARASGAGEAQSDAGVPDQGGGRSTFALGAQAIRDPRLLFSDPAAATAAARARVDEIEARRRAFRGEPAPTNTTITQEVQIKVDGTKDPGVVARQIRRELDLMLQESLVQVGGGVP